MQESASKWAISSAVLKWNGSLVIALFRMVGSVQMHSFRLPDLSLLSTSTKLLIQGVASLTGLSSPACSILSTSSLKSLLGGNTWISLYIIRRSWGSYQSLQRHHSIHTVSGLCLWPAWELHICALAFGQPLHVLMFEWTPPAFGHTMLT